MLGIAFLACRASPLDTQSEHLQGLERENSCLREQLETLQERLDQTTQHFTIRSPCYPYIDASVSSVDEEYRLVVIGTGGKAGVQPGYVFHVFRGSQYKGLIGILHVDDDRSVGTILHSKNPIEPGDSAATNL